MQTTGNGAMPRIAQRVSALLLTLLLAAGPAFAGVGGSVVPAFPGSPVNVGDLFNASIVVTNDSDLPNTADTISVNVFTTPSCGNAIGPCLTPDLNVFQMPATATGAALCSGDGVGFTFRGSHP